MGLGPARRATGPGILGNAINGTVRITGLVVTKSREVMYVLEIFPQARTTGTL